MRLLVSERYSSLFFFFNDTATTEIYTLSLHDALPIYPFQSIGRYLVERGELQLGEASMPAIKAWAAANPRRSEEHTSELQSRLHLVCRLLLEKKKMLYQMTKKGMSCEGVEAYSDQALR